MMSMPEMMSSLVSRYRKVPGDVPARVSLVSRAASCCSVNLQIKMWPHQCLERSLRRGVQGLNMKYRA